MEFTLNAFNENIQVPVSLMNDGVYELTETFSADLSFTSDVLPRTTISPNNTTITIFDDDGMFSSNKDTYRLSNLLHVFVHAMCVFSFLVFLFLSCFGWV